MPLDRLRHLFAYCVVASLILCLHASVRADDPELAVAPGQTTLDLETDDGEIVSVIVEASEGQYVMDGDIVLQPVSIQPGVGIRSFLRWDRGRIPYIMSPNHPNAAEIERAIRHLNDTTVLWFVPTQNAGSSHIDIVDGNACQSGVGEPFWGDGYPTMLGVTCDFPRILHELLHAAGLFHEQSRRDRNDHVQIFWQNIQSGKSSQFERHGWFLAREKDIGAYDLRSIMHYSSCAFSVNPNCTATFMQPTILTVSGAFIPFNSDLSAGDHAAIRAMYGTVPHPDKPVPTPPGSCTFAGTVVEHGQRIKAFWGPGGFCEDCVSEWRVCNNGVLSGSYGYRSCQSRWPTPPAECP